MTPNKNLKFYIVSFFLLLLLSSTLNAQDSTKTKQKVVSSCSQKLKELQKSYEQGVLEAIPVSLRPCLDNGFSKIEKLQAYRLIILTYLFLDEQKKAEEYMLELLRFEPDYKPNNSLDPIEYINLYNSFRVLPFISFGVIIGVNQTMPRMTNNYGVGNTESFPTTYSPAINFNVGASLDLLLTKKLFFTTDVFLMLRRFSSQNQILSTSKLTADENQTSINIPLTLKYVIGKNKMKIYIRGGGAIDLLLASQAQMIRKNTVINNQNDFAGPNVPLSDQRNRLNFAAVAGFGLTYKLGYGYLTLDARYYYGLSNITNTSQRYEYYTTQISNYGYLDNDLALDNIQISFGYMQSLFKIKKIKSKISSE